VPVWWYHPAGVLPIDAKLLSDDSVAFAEWSLSGFNANPALKYQIRRLDGTLVRTLQTVGAPTDFHELQELPNGNYLLVAYKPRDHVDLSAYGESSDSTVLDAEIQELSPGGQLVWSWNSKDHIDLDEAGRWWNTLNPVSLPDGRQAVDHLHINAVEPDGNGLLVSLRHADAIYRISRQDGHVEWKLGGTGTPESLTVTGDRAPPATLGGQHDVRRVPDGTVSVFDNGTGLGRPPRAARYAIDTGAGTATLVESVADPDITASGCCGSARRLGSGGWLLDWGGQPVVAEYGADGSRLFKLQINGATLYRAFPVPVARVSAERLRQGMDAMFPR
jgi:arylsulfotransferase ASST